MKNDTTVIHRYDNNMVCSCGFTFEQHQELHLIIMKIQLKERGLK